MVVTSYGIAAGSRKELLVATVIIGAVGLSLVPARLMPVLAVWLFVLVPVGYLGVPKTLTYVTPAMAVLAIWLVRDDATSADRRVPAVMWLAGLLAIWIGVCTLTSVDERQSLHWGISFCFFLLAFPLAALRRPESMRSMRIAFMAAGAALGAYGIVEVLVLQDNPLFGNAYASAPVAGFQQYTVWATYRATTTLGHPLLNSTFFVISAALCFGWWIKDRSSVAAAAGVLATGGVLLTGSRSGLVALACAVCVATGVAIYSRATRSRGLAAAGVILLLAVAAGGTLASTALTRQHSNEGASSSDARVTLVHQATALVRERPILGFGPGALGAASLLYSDNPSGNYENSYLETAQGIGVPGLLLLLGVYGLLAATAIRRRDVGLAGASVGYFVSQGAFNLIEGYKNAHFLLGALLAMAVVHWNSSAEPIPDAVGASDRSMAETARATARR
jgi:O-antigen ligase